MTSGIGSHAAVPPVHACISWQNLLCRLETELAKAGASARDADEVRREVRFTRRNSGALQVNCCGRCI
jgi:hypothetical protein